jgi:SulP family sulfate permease
LRVDADLFFANARPVERAIEQALSAHPAARELVLDMSAVNNIDLTGLEGLRGLNENLKRRDITLHLAEVKGPLQDRLERSGILHEFAHQPFRFIHDAFRALNAGD